ncbi:hypothetical protein CYY_001502 [Polysphondylium violaceum]|uniref:TRUD domain-containing protein n=1 Tax=Polysphondylium violaceum TaxID=133409 RepID=A0A8J4Q004_9MYCE|nr:hypothetical protein CYY_001502 [Polysphondylium violaceum]
MSDKIENQCVDQTTATVETTTTSDEKTSVASSLSTNPPTTTNTPQPTLAKLERTEETFGIKHYLSKTKPFTGLLKHRFTDFIVNEIDENGNVVKLVDTNYQKDEKTVEYDTTPEQDLEKLVGEEKTKSFMEFFNGPNKTDAKSFFIFDKDTDKDHRTLVHKVIKTRFILATETTNDNEVKVWPEANPKKKAINDRSWPADKPKYVQFVLAKENRDTMDTISLLSKYLRNSPKQFSIAGTKDKRGVTSQRVTVYKITPDRLYDVNVKLSKLNPPIRIGEYKFVQKQLMLGDLSGNRFSIVIRNVQGANDQEITESIEQFKQTGFINYFGLQRFGTGSIPTHEVGRAMIQGDWDKAAALLLDPREGERSDALAARQCYKETGNIKKTLDMMPKQLNSERMLLMGLKTSKSSQDAFFNIPRTMRMLYTHAYQSYIWNHMASKRIELYGLKAVVGDLVIVSEEEKNPKPSAATESDDKEKADAEPVEQDIEQDETSLSKKVIKVGYVTEQDVLDNKYSIFQVVLPIIGSTVDLPKNEIAEAYMKELEKDNIQLSQFVTKNRAIDLRGDYRRLLEKASDVTFKILNYDDATLPLAVSDIDALKKLAEPQDIPTGQHKALRVCFNLSSSTYATMAYREILKVPSDIISQMNMANSPSITNSVLNKRKLDELESTNTTTTTIGDNEKNDNKEIKLE